MKSARTHVHQTRDEGPTDSHLEALSAYSAEASRSGSSSQQAFDVLLGAIMSGVLPAGQRLAEIPVANAIGLGRTPVREALMRLESDGYVTAAPRLGMVVAGNTLEKIAELYEVREVLEGFASRLAARYARDTDIFAIRRTIDDSITPTEEHNVSQLRTLNTQFHEAIYAAAHNDQLRRILHNVNTHLRLSRASAYSAPGRAEAALTEHRAILEAIIARDEMRAEALASDHLRRDKEARLAQMTRADGKGHRP